MNDRKQCRIYRLCSFLLPVIILTAYFAAKSITPFGDGTFLIHDMNAQYIDFYAYFRTVLNGQNNFFYSFSRGLGGDFPSFFSYYLISPFNLIPLAFPDELLPIGISIEMILLFGLAGLSCYVSLEYFTQQNDAHQHQLFLLFLSAAYSLSGWMLLNAENFQFIQEACILPMVILNCQKAKSGDRLLPAILWTAAAIILNFYLGYMIFIFTFLWVIIPEKERLQKRIFLIFIISIIISAPVLIAVTSQFGSTVKDTDPLWYLPKFNFSLKDLLQKFLPGQFDRTQYQDNGLPAVYCTITAICAALCCLIFGKERKTIRHRTILLGILFLSLAFRPLTMIWQGFSQSHWWPYRFSFLLIYLIIICAAESSIPIPWYILPFGLASLIFNLTVTFDIKLEEAESLSTYAAQVQEKSALLASIDQDHELFRMEDLHPRTDNDAMHYAYAGITHFDSLANKKVFYFLEKIGFSRNRYTLNYGLGNTKFANALLGVRYVKNEKLLTKQELPSSVAILIDPEFLQDKINADDPYAFQNTLAMSLGLTSPVLTPVQETSIETVNLECDEQLCWKLDMEADASVIYHLQLSKDAFLYGHNEIENLLGDLYYLAENGERIALADSDYFIPMGKAGPDGSIDITIAVDLILADNPNLTFFEENTKEELEVFGNITRDIHVIKKSSSELLISFPKIAKEKVLLVTIPYDKRWHADTENTALTIDPVWNTFIGVQIPANISEIRLKYR